MKTMVKKFVVRPILILLIVLSITVTTVAIVLSIYVEKYIEKSIDESLFTPIGNGASTKIYYYEFSDRENRIGVLKEISDNELYSAYKCKSVRYEQLPEDLINAFVSIEDKRFFEHSGVDWKRTVSAGANYFLKFSNSYGGSTITQQLIKNVTNNDEYSFQRKLQEIFWALDLETKMDKREIITMYLNVINLSQGCFGVGAAAEYYYSKDVGDLSLSECATIAAITNSPTYYDPIRNPENNKKRRDLILKQMLEQGYIDGNEYTSAVSEDISLNIKKYESDKVNSWYVDMVIEDVINDLINQKGYSRQVANLMLYTGGLRIYTAMDKDVQDILENYYSDEKKFYNSLKDEMPQSGVIVIDPKTGDVLGVVGAVGKKTANRVQNFATQTVRPAGSVIKPLSVYAPAIESGKITWSTVYDDVPLRFNVTSGGSKYITWPKNANGIYKGLTNINYAVENSVNTVAVSVLDDVGLEESFRFLYGDLNMKSIISKGVDKDGRTITDIDYAALALGQFNYGVTLRETTAAYSVFANKGVYNEYRSYYKVTDIYGNEILSKKYNGKSLMSEENADIMTMMLQNVITNGTAKEMNVDKWLDVAGKTGTTQNNFDKWFIGYSPYYICGIWLGYEYPKSLTDYDGKSCNKIWDEITALLHQRYKNANNVEKFIFSDNIIEAKYCADSGKLLTKACTADLRGNRAEIGYFVKGTEPKEYCSIHVLVDYDAVTESIAANECPEENIISVGLINVKRSFPTQVYISDAEYVWRNIGSKVQPETASSLPFYANLIPREKYSGISMGEKQKNCYCREHFNYFLWKEKKDKANP